MQYHLNQYYLSQPFSLPSEIHNTGEVNETPKYPIPPSSPLNETSLTSSISSVPSVNPT